MTKGIDGMIRLHKWQLDEKRRQLTELETMRDDLLARKEQLAQQLVSEQEKVSNSQIIDISYANFATAIAQRQEKLMESMAEIEASIEDMKDQVSESFKELKKYEVVEQRERERQVAKENRRQQADLDELSIQMHRRNNMRAG
ncbi:flagellar FliJ family protein [Emcibacter sp.]|uniref:flagellar FliJ family protein n=1 Tax=Emcibacter sp. TaxID=1979954 RepID=UPI002AA79BA8|nr:flagellar FliJ family protein [Emcibacter sp.]